MFVLLHTGEYSKSAKLHAIRECRKDGSNLADKQEEAPSPMKGMGPVKVFAA
jgi:hypothetical protein